MRNPMQIFESQVIAMCCRLLVATILAAASPSQQEKAPSETDLSGIFFMVTRFSRLCANARGRSATAAA